MKTNFLKRITVVFTFLLLTMSCSKDDSSNEPINIDAGIVSNAQIAEITVAAEDLNQNIYDGTIDGMPIKVVKSSENELSFFIPNDLPTGNYSVLIPALDATVNVEVVATILNVSADETMTDFFTNMTTYSQTIDTSTPQGVDMALSISSFTNFYNNSNQEMKDALAVIYKANKAKFDNFFLNIDAGRSKKSVFSDFFADNKKAVYNIGVGAVLVFASPVIAGVGGVAVGVMGVLIAKKGCEEAYRSNALLIDNVYDDIKVKVNGFFGSNDKINENIVLIDKIEKQITFQVSRRKIIASDENKTTPLAVEYFDSYNRYNDFSEGVNQTIDNLNNSNVIDYGDVSLETLPSSSPEILVDVNSELFNNISFSINNSNIALQGANFLSDGQLNLKAAITGNPSTISVSSDLNYSYSNNFSEFSGKISLRVDPSFIGNWNLVNFENTIPVGQYVNLYSPTCPNVSYAKYTITSEVLSINETSYNYTENETYIYYNFGINTTTCTTFNDLADSQENYSNSATGTYTVNGNSFTATENGVTGTSSCSFINSNKIQIGDKVYTRQ